MPRNSPHIHKDIFDEIFAGSKFIGVEAFSKLVKDGYSFDSESDVDVGIFFSKGEEVPELLPAKSSTLSNRYDFKVINKKGQRANYKHWGLCIVGDNAAAFQRSLNQNNKVNKDIIEREEQIPVKPIIFTLQDLVDFAKDKKEEVKSKLKTSLDNSASALVEKVFKVKKT